MKPMYSYHIFYFPFRWAVKGRENLLLSEQTDLNGIKIQSRSNWERVRIPDKKTSLNEEEKEEYKDIYAEKNYYFEFVHSVLYDEEEKEPPILHHYERTETKEKGATILYTIKVKGRTYQLQVDAINLNMYATGVGILSFFLKNDREDQSSPKDIRIINQYGRRIMPPHYGEVCKRSLISEEIAILGLDGNYKEDFNESIYSVFDVWKPARFIKQLIADLSTELRVIPVIDDRMFVNCWYGNDELVQQFKESEPVEDPIEQANQKIQDERHLANFIEGDFWYKYLFVDEGDDETCQNDKMKTELLEDSTYYRWQKGGSLYGVSRYSLVLLASSYTYSFLGKHMQTIYSRMVELILVQRASTLRFSDEVTRVSRFSKGNKVNKGLIEQISSLYKEYIRFINQIHFREVTAQDQGIELYKLMSDTMKIEDYVKSLDKEIEELHHYINILDDKIRNENMKTLNFIAAIFVPTTLIISIFGMNYGKFKSAYPSFGFELCIILLCSLAGFISIWLLIKKNR
jgi:Mg2+ and Co2+ transporter CorA